MGDSSGTRSCSHLRTEALQALDRSKSSDGCALSFLKSGRRRRGLSESTKSPLEKRFPGMKSQSVSKSGDILSFRLLFSPERGGGLSEDEQTSKEPSRYNTSFSVAEGLEVT